MNRNLQAWVILGLMGLTRVALAGGVGMPWETGTATLATSLINNYLPYGLVAAIIGGVVTYTRMPDHDSLLHKVLMYGFCGAFGAGALTYLGFFGVAAGATLAPMP
jgi:hypothetical protein